MPDLPGRGLRHTRAAGAVDIFHRAIGKYFAPDASDDVDDLSRTCAGAACVRGVGDSLD